MSIVAESRCEQCGARFNTGADCEACFHALLAFENENPKAFGAVHHLTVTAYCLQHPRGYSDEALVAWRELLDLALTHDASPQRLRRLSSQRFDGSRRVKDVRGTPPPGWPRQWPMTVQAVLQPGERIEIDEYVGRAREWARQINATLGQPPK